MEKKTGGGKIPGGGSHTEGGTRKGGL